MSEIKTKSIMFYSNILITIIVLVSLADAKFPDDPKPCKYEDTECIANVIKYYLTQKNQGDSSLNLVKIDPLRVAKITINQGAESPVNIDLTFTNNDIHGLASGTVLKVKGFGSDLTKKHEIRFKFATLSLRGDYKISGRVLVLPISGVGKSNITMVDPELVMQFTGQSYEKNGATHMQISNLKLLLEPQGMFYHFDNLFNGDKALSDNMNLFLNENWKDIYNEVRASITAAFAQIFEKVVNNVFSKYPYAKYFAQ